MASDIFANAANEEAKLGLTLTAWATDGIKNEVAKECNRIIEHAHGDLKAILDAQAVEAARKMERESKTSRGVSAVFFKLGLPFNRNDKVGDAIDTLKALAQETKLVDPDAVLQTEVQALTAEWQKYQSFCIDETVAVSRKYNAVAGRPKFETQLCKVTWATLWDNPIWNAIHQKRRERMQDFPMLGKTGAEPTWMLLPQPKEVLRIKDLQYTTELHVNRIITYLAKKAIVRTDVEYDFTWLHIVAPRLRAISVRDEAVFKRVLDAMDPRCAIFGLRKLPDIIGLLVKGKVDYVQKSIERVRTHLVDLESDEKWDFLNSFTATRAIEAKIQEGLNAQTREQLERYNVIKEPAFSLRVAAQCIIAAAGPCAELLQSYFPQLQLIDSGAMSPLIRDPVERVKLDDTFRGTAQSIADLQSVLRKIKAVDTKSVDMFEQPWTVYMTNRFQLQVSRLIDSSYVEASELVPPASAPTVAAAVAGSAHDDKKDEAVEKKVKDRLEARLSGILAWLESLALVGRTDPFGTWSEVWDTDTEIKGHVSFAGAFTTDLFEAHQNFLSNFEAGFPLLSKLCDDVTVQIGRLSRLTALLRMTTAEVQDSVVERRIKVEEVIAHELKTLQPPWEDVEVTAATAAIIATKVLDTRQPGVDFKLTREWVYSTTEPLVKILKEEIIPVPSLPDRQLMFLTGRKTIPMRTGERVDAKKPSSSSSAVLDYTETLDLLLNLFTHEMQKISMIAGSCLQVSELEKKEPRVQMTALCKMWYYSLLQKLALAKGQTINNLIAEREAVSGQSSLSPPPPQSTAAHRLHNVQVEDVVEGEDYDDDHGDDHGDGDVIMSGVNRPAGLGDGGGRTARTIAPVGGTGGDRRTPMAVDDALRAAALESMFGRRV